VKRYAPVLQSRRINASILAQDSAGENKRSFVFQRLTATFYLFYVATIALLECVIVSYGLAGKRKFIIGDEQES